MARQGLTLRPKTTIGKVEEVNATRAKLRVMVSIFGRPTSVELDFTQVERLG